MNCEEARGQLGGLAARLLSSPEEAALREHLRVCADCARDAEEFSGIDKALAALPLPASDPAFVQRVRSQLVSSRQSLNLWPFREDLWEGVAAAAILLGFSGMALLFAFPGMGLDLGLSLPKSFQFTVDFFSLSQGSLEILALSGLTVFALWQLLSTFSILRAPSSKETFC